MLCSDFLELYSDYRDGLITDPAVARRIQRHLRMCRRCMDYDALVSRGVMALRSTNDLRPSTLFRHQFSRRLRATQAEGTVEAVRPAPAGIMAALMVAAAVALAVWPDAETVTAPSVAPTVAADAGATTPPPAPEPVYVPNAELVTPAFREAWLAQPAQEVTFETWVALPR